MLNNNQQRIEKSVLSSVKSLSKDDRDSSAEMDDSDSRVLDSQAQSSMMVDQNKTRVKKARITADFIRKLPEGITYHESCSSGDDNARQVNELGNGDEEDNFKEGDIVRVGKFQINIEKVTKAQLISMRKFLPPTQYRLIKNRKTARLCRRKRKEERGDMQRLLEDLRKENMWYKIKLEDTEKKLAESERARALEKELNHAESLANMSNMIAANNPQVVEASKVHGSDNVDLNELIRNALRRGSVTSNFINQQTQMVAPNQQETHNQIQRSFRTLSLPNIYNLRGIGSVQSNKDKESTIAGNNMQMHQMSQNSSVYQQMDGKGPDANVLRNYELLAASRGGANPADNHSNRGGGHRTTYYGDDNQGQAMGGGIGGASHTGPNGMGPNGQVNDSGVGENSHQQPVSPSQKDSNNLLSVSHMFHRNNLRSLSLASVSDLTKAQIANYVSQYINQQPKHQGMSGLSQGYQDGHRGSIGHVSYHPPVSHHMEDLRSNNTVSLGGGSKKGGNSQFNQKTPKDIDYGAFYNADGNSNAGIDQSNSNAQNLARRGSTAGLGPLNHSGKPIPYGGARQASMPNINHHPQRGGPSADSHNQQLQQQTQQPNNQQILQDELMRQNAARQSNQARAAVIHASQQAQAQPQRQADQQVNNGVFGGLSSYQFGQAGQVSTPGNTSNQQENNTPITNNNQPQVQPNPSGQFPNTSVQKVDNNSPSGQIAQQQAKNGPPAPMPFNNQGIFDPSKQHPQPQQQQSSAQAPLQSDSAGLNKPYQMPQPPSHHQHQIHNGQGGNAAMMQGQKQHNNMHVFIPPHLIKQNRSHSLIPQIRRNPTLL